MAHVLNDRVKETTTSTGTGTINLAGADAGFESFVSAIGNSNTTYYAIAHQTSNEFEIGIGTVTDASPDTLSRTTVISSTNSDSLVDFSAGTKDVFCTLPASKAVFFDESSGSSDVAIGSRGTNPMGLGITGTVLAVTEATNVASLQMDGNQASRIDMGSGPGNRQFIIYTDTSNYSELKRTDAKPILFGTDNTERLRILQGGGVQLAAGNNISNASGDLTLDVVGIINLDADNGGNINLKDGGTLYGTLQKENNDLRIVSTVQDGDIIFRGNDGGSYVNALTLDMSENGNAIFNGTVNAGLKFINNAWNASAEGRNRFYFGTNSHTYLQTGDAYYFRNSSDVDIVIIDGSGNAYFDGNVTAYYSDERLKDKQGKIKNALDKVSQIETFYFKENELAKSLGHTVDKKQVGVSAQSVYEVLPEIVDLAPFDTDHETGESKSGEDYMTVDYAKLTPLLIEAIKEQQEQIDTLNDYVKLQSATIMDMERRLNELEDK